MQEKYVFHPERGSEIYEMFAFVYMWYAKKKEGCLREGKVVSRVDVATCEASYQSNTLCSLPSCQKRVKLLRQIAGLARPTEK